MSDKIKGMKFVKPDKSLTVASIFDQDDFGYWPMYIYTYGIDCA